MPKILNEKSAKRMSFIEDDDVEEHADDEVEEYADDDSSDFVVSAEGSLSEIEDDATGDTRFERECDRKKFVDIRKGELHDLTHNAEALAFQCDIDEPIHKGDYFSE